MKEVAEIAFRSWNEYKRDLLPELFGEHPFQSGRYLFRGCGRSEWNLVSVFDRRFSHLSTADRINLWDSLVKSFRAACQDYGVGPAILQSERSLIAFGQHYGLPTRMLDWSLSPYVATFFAVRHALDRSESQHMVAVWVLDTESEAWSEEKGGVEIVSPPTLENLRLRNQAGRFTLARTSCSSLEEHVQLAEWSIPPLLKMLFPATEAVHAIPDLEAMGVTAERLFPDFTGLAESVIVREELSVLASRQRAPRTASR